MFTREAMTARYWEIVDAEEAIREKAAPLRARQDEIAARLGPIKDEERANNAAIREAEAGLAELMSEKAMLARAIGRAIGERPARA